MQALILGISVLITVLAAFLLVGTLFPKLVSSSRKNIDEMAGRAFWLGLVNTLFLVAVMAGLGMIVNITQVQALILFPVVVAAMIVIFAVTGLTGLSQSIGERLFADRSQIQQHLLGAGVMTLGSLTPFVGWYFLLPYMLIVGIGSVVATLSQGWRDARNKPEE
ncbi:MAG: hypothetical protein OEZ02_03450 [Anaerolineae bacterium]|nr:hypothetical protein [Anaerolineae bacterium]